MSIEASGSPEKKEKRRELHPFAVVRQNVKLSDGMKVKVVEGRPENQTDVMPIFFAQAFLMKTGVYAETLKAMTESGRHTVTFEQPRIGAHFSIDTKTLDKERGDIIRSMPREEVRKALTFLDMAEKLRLKEMDLVAHSEGCVWAAIAEVLRPGTFPRMVLAAPPGLIGKDSFARLTKGWKDQAKPIPPLEAHVTDEERNTAFNKGYDLFGDPSPSEKELSKQVAFRSIPAAASSVLLNPLRTVQEIRGLTDVHIHRLLKYLSENKEHPVDITVMTNEGDPLFDAKKTREMLKDLSNVHTLSVPYGHGATGEYEKLGRLAANKLELMKAGL